MTFIKKHYLLLTAAVLLIANMTLVYFKVLVPAWVIWVLILAVLAFVSWQIVKTFVNEYRKAKKQKERKQIIILACVVGVVGAALFAGIHFSGLSQRLFPGYF